jgi:hypothetical protein
MINYTRNLSFSESKDKARQAVLEFLPHDSKNIISLPAESFMFEAQAKMKNPGINIYGFEFKQRIISRNKKERYFIAQEMLTDYIHGDVLKADLSNIDFAWLDLCSTPSVEVQSRFITQARSAKSGSRIVITLTRKIRYMKEQNKPLATIEQFVKGIHYLTNGKIVKQYDYTNGRSPMTMLFIQF